MSCTGCNSSWIIRWAYTVLGLAGWLPPLPGRLGAAGGRGAGMLCALPVPFLHGASVYFAEYANAVDTLGVLLYSLSYNGTYMAVEALVSAVLVCMPQVQRRAEANRLSVGPKARRARAVAGNACPCACGRKTRPNGFQTLPTPCACRRGRMVIGELPPSLPPGTAADTPSCRALRRPALLRPPLGAPAACAANAGRRPCFFCAGAAGRAAGAQAPERSRRQRRHSRQGARFLPGSGVFPPRTRPHTAYGAGGIGAGVKRFFADHIAPRNPA